MDTEGLLEVIGSIYGSVLEDEAEALGMLGQPEPQEMHAAAFELDAQFAPPDDLDPEFATGGAGLGQSLDCVVVGQGDRLEPGRNGGGHQFARFQGAIGRGGMGMEVYFRHGLMGTAGGR